MAPVHRGNGDWGPRYAEEKGITNTGLVPGRAARTDIKPFSHPDALRLRGRSRVHFSIPFFSDFERAVKMSGISRMSAIATIENTGIRPLPFILRDQKLSLVRSQTTNDFFISPSFMIEIFPPLCETTSPIASVIWLIPATDECRVP